MTTEWITQTSLEYAPVDLDVLQESALSMAQSTIQNAMDEAGLKPAQLAKKMGQHRSFVSRMLNSRQNLTIKTFALALAGCGFRVQFGYKPLRSGWSAEAAPSPPVQHQYSVPASASTSVGANLLRLHRCAHRVQ
jgi:hypothetical protein